MGELRGGSIGESPTYSHRDATPKLPDPRTFNPTHLSIWCGQRRGFSASWRGVSNLRRSSNSSLRSFSWIEARRLVWGFCGLCLWGGGSGDEDPKPKKSRRLDIVELDGFLFVIGGILMYLDFIYMGLLSLLICAMLDTFKVHSR